MSRIRSKDTKPELLIRKAMHAAGYRFRIHRKDLPGNPDIVLPKYHAIIFINGCFWHGHDCHLYRLPKTNAEFWEKKIDKNRRNDRLSIEKLAQDSWRIMIIWECAIKGKMKLPLHDIVSFISDWLLSNSSQSEIKGGNACGGYSVSIQI